MNASTKCTSDRHADTGVLSSCFLSPADASGHEVFVLRLSCQTLYLTGRGKDIILFLRTARDKASFDLSLFGPPFTKKPFRTISDLYIKKH